MSETVVVVAIIGVVIVLTLRSLQKTLSGRNDGCGCSCKGSCQLSGSDREVSSDILPGRSAGK
jgi:hypothetical protein